MRNKILMNLYKVLPILGLIGGLSFATDARSDLDAASICSSFPGYYSAEFSATALVAGYAPSQWCNYLFPPMYNLAQLQTANQFNTVPYNASNTANTAAMNLWQSLQNLTHGNPPTTSITNTNNGFYFNNAYYTTVNAAQQNTQNNITSALNTSATYYPTALSTTLAYTSAPDLPTATNPPSMPYTVPPSGYTFSSTTGGSSTSFDINTLLGPLQYPVSPNKGTYPPYQPAQNFIVLSGELANPPKALTFAYSDRPYTADEVVSLISKNTDTVGSYLAWLHAYTAQVGAAVGNLNMFYAERMPATNLAKQAGIPNKYPGLNPSATNDASPLLVKQFLATQRLNDPNWYNVIQSASPAELQRQTVVLLAEMRAEMFYQTEEIKRLNATLSIMVLQNANNSRLLMETQGYNNAAGVIEKAKDSDSSQ